MTLTLSYREEIDIVEHMVECISMIADKVQQLLNYKSNLIKVISLDNVKHIYLQCRNDDVEIKYAFNDKVVIQQQKKQKKVTVFVPEKWEGELDISTENGDIISLNGWSLKKMSLNSKCGSVRYI